SHEQHRSQLGVCCFSRSIRSLLLWAHYAESHKGVCLQFYVARDPDVFCQAIPVEYELEYPVVNWTNDSDLDALKGVLRKHPSWAYEEECRIVSPSNCRKYFQFKPAALTGIVLGCRIAESTIQAIDTLLAERVKKGHPPVKVYNVSQSGDSYELIVRRRQ